MSAWVLCVILDIHSPSSRACYSEPDKAACIKDLRDWVWRSIAWEDRSGLHATAFAVCGPRGIVAP